MRLFLVISQLLYVLSLGPWVVIWMMSFMSFDSGIGLWNSLFVITIGIYPIAILVCSILAWVKRVHKRRQAIIINLVPSLWIIAFKLLMLLP